MGNRAGTLVEVAVGDDPTAWRSIGFTVSDEGVCQVGAVRIRLVGGAVDRRRGILGWTLAGCSLAGDVDGLPTVDADAGDVPTPPDPRPPVHPNGVTQIDHLVVVTPDLDRTTAAIEAAGVAARRTREAGRGRLQRFFRLGEVIVEVVGPVEPSGDAPARFWGFAFTVADIDATASHLTGRVGEPKQAVQAGQRIATLRSDDGVSVAVAFMSGDEPVAPGRPGDTPR
jgi:hypothetical protein